MPRSWTRLLLPSLLMLELASWLWHLDLWPLRIGAIVALETAFVLVAIRELRRRAGDPLQARLASAFGAFVPQPIARFAAFELVILGSALRFVAGRCPSPPGFTYHRESGLRVLLPLLPLLAVGDILLLELVVLPHAAPWLRVVVHALALYGLVWLIGIYAALRARPHQLDHDMVRLHRGLVRRIDIPRASIRSIEPLPAFADDWKKRAYTRGAIRLDVGGPTILELHLDAPVRPVGIFGEGRPGTRVLLAVDEPAAFTAALTGSS
jgi:hypothetical protein